MGVPLLLDIAGRQAGVLGRSQVLAAGLTQDYIRSQILAGRWRRIHPGVYLTCTGPISRASEIWAALVYAGPGAVVSHETAAEVWGFDKPTSRRGSRTGADGELMGVTADGAPHISGRVVHSSGRVVHISVPATRRVKARPGVRIHCARGLSAKTHPARSVPVTRVEDTVFDLTTAAANVKEVIDQVMRACGRRATTPQRLATAMKARRRLRWRRLLECLVDDISEGADSPLELIYLRDVERAHGLPTGRRQRHRTVGRKSQWIDVDYDAYRLIVELDGRVGHEGEERFRDYERDNVSTLRGKDTLRYGWTDTTVNACRVAAEVGEILRRNGWSGIIRTCGPACDTALAA